MDYAPKVASALRMLTKYGQTVQLKVQTVGAYDPNTLAPANSYTTELRKAVLLDFDRINFGVTQADFARIQKDDRRCLMDAKGTRPQVKDLVTVGGVDYPIFDIKILSPSGVDILYDMLLRK